MASRILQSFTRSAPTATRTFQQRTTGMTIPIKPNYTSSQSSAINTHTVLPTVTTRAYALNPSSDAQSQNNSNAANPQSSSADAQDVNAKAATRGTKDQDTGSVANPVSHPEDAGLGAQEEPTRSQDAMSHDPNESQQSKKEKTLKFGQNQPLDAADK